MNCSGVKGNPRSRAHATDQSKRSKPRTIRSRSRPVRRARKLLSLPLAAETLFFARCQFVADAVAEDFVEALGRVDAETKDQDFLTGFPVAQDLIHDGGKFRVAGVVAFIHHIEQDFEVTPGICASPNDC